MRIICKPIKHFITVKVGDLIIINAERVEYQNVLYCGYLTFVDVNRFIIEGVCFHKSGSFFQRESLSFGLLNLKRDWLNKKIDVYLVYDSASKTVFKTLKQNKKFQNINFFKDILYIQHG